jgi:methionyl-tRNA synthetase
MADNQINLGLKEISSMATFCDMFIQAHQPWVMAKDPSKATLLSAILYQLLESLRIVALLVSPVLPRAAHGIFDQLNWKMELSGKEERFLLADAAWGKLPNGHIVGKPVPLFPRIEVD